MSYRSRLEQNDRRIHRSYGRIQVPYEIAGLKPRDAKIIDKTLNRIIAFVLMGGIFALSYYLGSESRLREDNPQRPSILENVKGIWFRR